MYWYEIVKSCMYCTITQLMRYIHVLMTQRDLIVNHSIFLTKWVGIQCTYNCKTCTWSSRTLWCPSCGLDWILYLIFLNKKFCCIYQKSKILFVKIIILLNLSITGRGKSSKIMSIELHIYIIYLVDSQRCSHRRDKNNTLKLRGKRLSFGENEKNQSGSSDSGSTEEQVRRLIVAILMSW